ncbi:MAG: dihydrofolate reductase [Sarcina sp.]
MFSIIVALDKNNLIGKENSLIWHIPADLKRFKELTSGHKIIMGRKTFESLPKILPNREHLILTKNKHLVINNPQVKIYTDAIELIKKYSNCDEEIFVIGGGEIYSLLLPYTKKLYVTEILDEFTGDTYFPKIDTNEWITIFNSDYMEFNNIKFKYKIYIK